LYRYGVLIKSSLLFGAQPADVILALLAWRLAATPLTVLPKNQHQQFRLNDLVGQKTLDIFQYVIPFINQI